MLLKTPRLIIHNVDIENKNDEEKRYSSKLEEILGFRDKTLAYMNCKP